MSLLPVREYDEIHDDGSTVIIAGYGRFGQIVGRFLAGQGVKIIVLEKDPEQVELVRKFSGRGRAFFGDASRLDLLQSAGAARAKLLVVAVDDADKCLEIVRLAKKEFPNLTVLARARNRRHAYELDKAGVDYYRRETFDSVADACAAGNDLSRRATYRHALQGAQIPPARRAFFTPPRSNFSTNNRC